MWYKLDNYTDTWSINTIYSTRQFTRDSLPSAAPQVNCLAEYICVNSTAMKEWLLYCTQTKLILLIANLKHNIVFHFFLARYISRHSYCQLVALHTNFRPCVTLLAQFTLGDTHIYTCSCCVPPSKIWSTSSSWLFSAAHRCACSCLIFSATFSHWTVTSPSFSFSSLAAL